MSYFRPMGDGPVTSPSEVDDTIIVGETSPKRVSCEDLPPDSPWRKPGQVCAPNVVTDFFRGLYNTLTAPTFSVENTAPTTTTPTTASSSPSLLVLAAAGGLAYYLYKRKRRT